MRRFACRNFQNYTELNSKLSYTPCYKYVKQKLYNMKKNDKIKTTAWLKITDERDYLEGKIHSIIEQKCLDGSTFEKINIQFDDGRILPCLREELEVINS